MSRRSHHILHCVLSLLLTALVLAPCDELSAQICAASSKSEVTEILDRLNFVTRTDSIGFVRASNVFEGIQLGDRVQDEDSVVFRTDSAWVRIAVSGDTKGKIVLGPPGLRQRATKSLAKSGGYKFHRDEIGNWTVTTREQIGGAVSVDLDYGCLQVKRLDNTFSILGTELVIEDYGGDTSILADGCIAINEPIGNYELQPTLVWNAPESGAASRYRLEILEGQELVYSDTTVDAALTVHEVGKRLRPGTFYTWRVGSENAAGDTLQWSEPLTFSTAPLRPPRLLSPSNGTEGLPVDPVFRWSEGPVPVADYYRIEVTAPNKRKYVHLVSNDGTMSFVFVEGERVERETTSYTLSELLSPDTRYSWRVRAFSQGVAGDWSPSWTFRTKPTIDTYDVKGVEKRDPIDRTGRVDSVATVDSAPPTPGTRGALSSPRSPVRHIAGVPAPVSPGVVRNPGTCEGPPVSAGTVDAALSRGYLPASRVGRLMGFKLTGNTVEPITDEAELNRLSNLLDDMNTRIWEKSIAAGVVITVAAVVIAAWAVARPKPRSSATVPIGF